MEFAYEAMRADGSVVADVLEAPARDAAVDALREKGLLPLRLEEQRRAAHAQPVETGPVGGRIRTQDLVLFTRQMKMLLEAGSPLVPALQAAEIQTARPAMRAVLSRLRERVEQGESLSRALDAESRHFDPVFRTMVAAGEATGALPQVFGQLCELAQQQQKTRKLVTGALLYPAILTGLLMVVIGILLFFVVPRFRILFQNLNTPLPTTTRILFDLSQAARTGWPFAVGGLLVAGAAVVVLARMPSVRAWYDALIVRLPLVGPLVSRLIFARVIRVWAAMLRCHVPLLETIRQSREAVRNGAYLHLLAQVEEVVTSGGRVGPALAEAGIADPIIVSALRTGEENGRLAEAAEFVSNWMDEDNANAVQQLTRLTEPLLLAVMGVFVGFIAMSLFVPLFDMATAAH
jgi:type II secretory pathway component PulF